MPKLDVGGIAVYLAVVSLFCCTVIEWSLVPSGELRDKIICLSVKSTPEYDVGE